MPTINDYYEQAQLSLAAYGEGFIQGMFGGGVPGNEMGTEPNCF